MQFLSSTWYKMMVKKTFSPNRKSKTPFGFQYFSIHPTKDLSVSQIPINFAINEWSFMYFMWASRPSHLMFISSVVLAFGRHCLGRLALPLVSFPKSFVSLCALSLSFSRLYPGSFPFSLPCSTMLDVAEVPTPFAMAVVSPHFSVDLPCRYRLPAFRVLSFPPLRNPSRFHLYHEPLNHHNSRQKHQKSISWV